MQLPLPIGDRRGIMTKAVAYLRLSKADYGHGLDVQRDSVERFCERRGLVLVGSHVDDGASGRSTRKRPGLAACIEAMRSGSANAIVATRVDRLARSSLDFHRIDADVQRAGGTILFSEQESLSLDSPEGRMLVSILSSFAAFEADMISARTRAALAHVKQHGSKSGRAIGNPNFRACPEPVAQLIRDLRAEGQSYRAIAAELSARTGRRPQGGHRRAVPGRVQGVARLRRPRGERRA
jgi:DNA invertase Pin-like site-specific DNA recombinase